MRRTFPIRARRAAVVPLAWLRVRRARYRALAATYQYRVTYVTARMSPRGLLPHDTPIGDAFRTVVLPRAPEGVVARRIYRSTNTTPNTRW